VRALLDLMRENRATVQDMAGEYLQIMDQGSMLIKVLDPETGNKELIKSWAVEVAQLRRG
jgi:hypothetical protein